ncbi:MAG: arsenosugar biosynthesis radical SAM protein ArsS [Spirochaetota bacterium]|nr:arsenosugar biosynthesis radical SAM protein ArsS [Spirochaetota bacterium]
MQSIKFLEKIKSPISKDKISTLQINLGRKCNQSCKHCHVEASPKRTEEISNDVKASLIKVIKRFDQIKTVDLTGGAPECHNGFRDIVKIAAEKGKTVIVRSNLTIYFENGFEDLPDFFKEHNVKVVGSLPCYLEQNVDNMRGNGVYKKSIQAILELNKRGYGDTLTLDLVFNPALPKSNTFSSTPNEKKLEEDYKKYLKDNFNIQFNSLLAFTNIPIGRFYRHLKQNNLENEYLNFLENQYNPVTLERLMCRDQLSIDYTGIVYDCDFNLISNIPSTTNGNGKDINLNTILEKDSLDLIKNVQVRDYCFACTAGQGSSCRGTLV